MGGALIICYNKPGDDDDDGNGNGAMGSDATGYDDNDDGCGRRR